MSEHTHSLHGPEHRIPEHRSIERHCDVAVVGGSAAGLAAALQLGRQRRAVIVIDAGEPRNAPAAHIHGYLGHEGLPPADFTAIGREEVRSYGGEVLAGHVADVSRTEDGRFRVETVGGLTVVARRVLAATGLVDELPDIDGLAENWGIGVIHCPFCHGFEVRDRRIVSIITHPMGLHQAGLFRQLTDRLTLVLHDGVESGDERLAELRAAGVQVLDERVNRIIADVTRRIVAVELVGGDRVEADAVVVGTRFRVRADIFASSGLAPSDHPMGIGDFVEVDAIGQTCVSGLFAAGNVTDPMQQVSQAAAHGSRVGAMIAADLVTGDLAAASRPSANEHEWDERYSGAQMWSGNPNGALVAEVTAVAPGRVLDVGAGEGGDAIWLAERGWQVTATDISERALARVAAAADERGLTIDTARADANGLEPIESNGFDLVTSHYPAIPRSPDNCGIHNLLDAVAVGGTLLVVSHDAEPMRVGVGTARASQMFDPDAYVHADDVARVVAATDGWTIEVHERRERPDGASSHHLLDVVFRAIRR